MYSITATHPVFSPIFISAPSGHLHVPGDPRYNDHPYNDQNINYHGKNDITTQEPNFPVRKTVYILQTSAMFSRPRDNSDITFNKFNSYFVKPGRPPAYCGCLRDKGCLGFNGVPS